MWPSKRKYSTKWHRILIKEFVIIFPVLFTDFTPSEKLVAAYVFKLQLDLVTMRGKSCID